MSPLGGNLGSLSNSNICFYLPFYSVLVIGKLRGHSCLDFFSRQDVWQILSQLLHLIPVLFIDLCIKVLRAIKLTTVFQLRFNSRFAINGSLICFHGIQSREIWIIIHFSQAKVKVSVDKHYIRGNFFYGKIFSWWSITFYLADLSFNCRWCLDLRLEALKFVRLLRLLTLDGLLKFRSDQRLALLHLKLAHDITRLICVILSFSYG